MKKNEKIEIKGQVKIYYLDENPIQIVWSAPEARDDAGKVRCPSGWVKIRLWLYNGRINLSQGYKAFMGGGDVVVRRDIKIVMADICKKDEEEITNILFDLKGDTFLDDAVGGVS
jgi:hypothetical protein